MNIPDEYKTGNPGMDKKIAKALGKENIPKPGDIVMVNPYGREDRSAPLYIPKQNKYSNTKTVVDGITFDSKKEAKRYRELRLMEKAGEIRDLRLQPTFVLSDSFDRDGKKYRAVTYRADFSYHITDHKYQVMRLVVEDVKGMKTEVYKIKKKLLLAQNPLIIFREI